MALACSANAARVKIKQRAPGDRPHGKSALGPIVAQARSLPTGHQHESHLAGGHDFGPHAARFQSAPFAGGIACEWEKLGWLESAWRRLRGRACEQHPEFGDELKIQGVDLAQ